MSGLPLDAANQPALATAVIEDETNETFEARAEVHAVRWARHAEPGGVPHGGEGLPGEHRLEPRRRRRSAPIPPTFPRCACRARRRTSTRCCSTGSRCAPAWPMPMARTRTIRGALPAGSADRRDGGLQPHGRAAAGPVALGRGRWASTTSCRLGTGDFVVHVGLDAAHRLQQRHARRPDTPDRGYNVTNASVGYRFERAGKWTCSRATCSTRTTSPR